VQVTQKRLIFGRAQASSHSRIWLTLIPSPTVRVAPVARDIQSPARSRLGHTRGQ
jgi:hypothetical protein